MAGDVSRPPDGDDDLAACRRALVVFQATHGLLEECVSVTGRMREQMARSTWWAGACPGRTGQGTDNHTTVRLMQQTCGLLGEQIRRWEEGPRRSESTRPDAV